MSTYLFGQATAKIVQAERCRSVADTIDLRRAAVTERHRPVAALHREEVWMGRAASASRAKLHRVIGAALYSLGLELATASRALRSEAGRLEQEAAVLRSQGRAAADAEARAARAQTAADAEARAARAQTATP